MQEMEYSILMEESSGVPDVGAPGDVMAGASASATAANAPKPVSVETGSLKPKDVADQLQNPRVRAIAPDIPMTLIKPKQTAASQPDGFDGDVAWGIKAVGADQSEFSGQGIIVAVLDTGIDKDHPAFAGVELIQKNYTQEADGDLDGHGTHCAGTIFGRDVDGKRIGVARGIKKAIIAKTLGAGGGGSIQIFDAINWATQQGAHIISMSLGMDFPGYVKRLIERFDLAVEEATSLGLEGYRANVNLFTQLAQSLSARSGMGAGAMIVAASGNECRAPEFEINVAPPAAATDITAVGAVARGAAGFEVANFSNRRVNIVAPGVAVESAGVGGGLKSLDGTSMATPHAAGVAALIAEKMKFDTGTINSNFVRAKLDASGSSSLMAADHRSFADVGNGIIQAPRLL